MDTPSFFVLPVTCAHRSGACGPTGGQACIKHSTTPPKRGSYAISISESPSNSKNSVLPSGWKGYLVCRPFRKSTDDAQNSSLRGSSCSHWPPLSPWARGSMKCLPSPVTVDRRSRV